MNYGMPYQGSKNKIVRWLMDVLPPADVFVDLFGGGGAVSHAALLSGKYRRVIYNELEPTVAKGFDMAVHGKFKGEDRWISREDFIRLKDTDPYAAICFSFGNDRKGYAYAPEVEPWKKAVHYARKFGDFSEFAKFGIHTDGSRADIKAHKDEYKALYIKWYMKNVMLSDKEYNIKKDELERNIKAESERLRTYLINARNAAGISSTAVDKHLGTNGMAGHYFGRSQWEFPTRENYIKMQEIMPALDRDFDDVVGLSTLWQSLERLERLQSLESLESLESLQSLERLQRLQSLERLERLERLEIYNTSYENVPIPENAVVYCDIPYRNTKGYNEGGFDHERFYEWALSRPYDVYISEYGMPDSFYEIDNTKRQGSFSSVTSTATTERLFCNHKKQSFICEQICFPWYVQKVQ